MAMAARERVTEIAVMRTLGFPKGTILGLILGESVLVAVFGGLFGIAVFTLIEPAIKGGLMTTPLGTFASGFSLYPGILLLAFLVAVGVGLVAGVVPAVRSAQRSIVDGLRQVG
jgi:putative ABC transport system permease protein